MPKHNDDLVKVRPSPSPVLKHLLQSGGGQMAGHLKPEIQKCFVKL